jgi:spermidine synthase
VAEVSIAPDLLGSALAMKRWVTLSTIDTLEGELELRQRGDQHFLITIEGRVLMTSGESRSEQTLATRACALIANRNAPRVLIGGLGMAYTLRAALDVLPPTATVTVAELTPVVETWCRGPLGVLTNNAVADPRVRVVIGDVSRVIADAPPAAWDAILLDLYEGPNAQTQGKDDPFYGTTALARSRAALAPGGVLSIWSEDPDAPFERRFGSAGFKVGIHRLGSSRVHVVYLGRRT